MKKKITLLVALIVMGMTCVKAEECTNSEKVRLDTLASLVKTTYEVTEIDSGERGFVMSCVSESGEGCPQDVPIMYKAFKVGILNVTDELKVVVTPVEEKEGTTYTKANASEDGIIYFTTGEAYDVARQYKISIYVNSGACSGTLLQERTLTLPIYNEYSEYVECLNYPDLDVCQQYLNKPLDIDTFFQAIETYENTVTDKPNDDSKEKSFMEKLKDFYRNHKVIILSGIGIIGIAGVATTVIVIKKRRSRVL